MEPGGWAVYGDILRGERRTVTGFSPVPYDIPRGSAGAYFPEANPLVPLESFAAGSRTPTAKYVIITVVKSAGG